MALWPNTRRDLLGFGPAGIATHFGFMGTRQPVQRVLAVFVNDAIANTSSFPEGAFTSAVCVLAPLVAGGMAAAGSGSDIELSASANVLAAGPVSGDADVTVSQSGALSLQVTLNGDGSITFSGDGGLALTIGLSADGNITLSGDGGLSMIVPISGDAPLTATADADLRGILSLSGDITPFSELSPQNLAAAVWQQVLDAGYTAESIMRILASVAAGKTDIDTSGANPVITFRDLDDTKDRVTATMSGSERATVTLDPS